MFGGFNKTQIWETRKLADTRYSEFFSIEESVCLYVFVVNLKHVCDMTRAYSQMHHTDKYSQQSYNIWSVWLNG